MQAARILFHDCNKMDGLRREVPVHSRGFFARRYCIQVAGFIAFSVLAAGLPGIGWAASLSGTWSGTGVEKICGARAAHPVQITLSITQLAQARDAYSSAATDPLLES